ncbi:RNA-binding protein EWS [Galemys pyrenaicus]|uniref:RNA-binding protein EWS n=1 Tax=Galemys pyrenaicus TaxID=202257 RepID=A0A8J6DWG0_GALPY|nr:RNA-binding protein EWS [Galemys pyrenaicus]
MHRPQVYGQQSYGTCAQPPIGYTITAAPQGYSEPVHSYSIDAYDATTAVVTAAQVSHASQSACGTQSVYPAYGLQPALTIPAGLKDGNKPTDTSQLQYSKGGCNQPSLGYEQGNYSSPRAPGSYPMYQSPHHHPILPPPIPPHS